TGHAYRPLPYDEAQVLELHTAHRHDGAPRETAARDGQHGPRAAARGRHGRDGHGTLAAAGDQEQGGRERREAAPDHRAPHGLKSKPSWRAALRTVTFTIVSRRTAKTSPRGARQPTSP